MRFVCEPCAIWLAWLTSPLPSFEIWTTAWADWVGSKTTPPNCACAGTDTASAMRLAKGMGEMAVARFTGDS